MAQWSMVLSNLECAEKVILGSFYLLEDIEPKKLLSDIEALNPEVLASSKENFSLWNYVPRLCSLSVTFVDENRCSKK